MTTASASATLSVRRAVLHMVDYEGRRLSVFDVAQLDHVGHDEVDALARYRVPGSDDDGCVSVLGRRRDGTALVVARLPEPGILDTLWRAALGSEGIEVGDAEAASWLERLSELDGEEFAELRTTAETWTRLPLAVLAP